MEKANLTISPLPAAEAPMELIADADESPESIADYIERGSIYGGFIGGNLVAEYILLHTRPFTAEIVNLAVAENYRGRGIGRQMINPP